VGLTRIDVRDGLAGRTLDVPDRRFHPVVAL
jgi:hypothetical protein